MRPFQLARISASRTAVCSAACRSAHSSPPARRPPSGRSSPTPNQSACSFPASWRPARFLPISGRSVPSTDKRYSRAVQTAAYGERPMLFRLKRSAASTVTVSSSSEPSTGVTAAPSTSNPTHLLALEEGHTLTMLKLPTSMAGFCQQIGKHACRSSHHSLRHSREAPAAVADNNGCRTPERSPFFTLYSGSLLHPLRQSSPGRTPSSFNVANIAQCLTFITGFRNACGKGQKLR